MTTPTTLEERLIRAATTGNLSLKEHGRTDADMVIAAGWSRVNFGRALMRLISEWDSMARRGAHLPQRPNRAAVAAAAMQEHGPTPTKEQRQATRERLDAEYVAQLNECMARLHSLPGCRLHLSIKMAVEGATDPESRAAQMLLHWLSPTCPECFGRGHRQKPDEQELEEDPCEACDGTGKKSPPLGNDGKRWATYMDECHDRARDDLRQKLRDVDWAKGLVYNLR